MVERLVWRAWCNRLRDVVMSWQWNVTTQAGNFEQKLITIARRKRRRINQAKSRPALGRTSGSTCKIHSQQVTNALAISDPGDSW
jgi:hypothetical protein